MSEKIGSPGSERKCLPYKIVILGDGGVGKSGRPIYLYISII